MVSKTLVTTALEKTWPDNKHSIIFLGEWCLRHSRRKVWGSLNYDVAKYHWDDRRKLYADYQYLNELHESLLCEMQIYLNKLHGTSHSVRYWRIQLGPWMGFFIPMLFDRWTMLKNVKRDYDISEVYSIKSKLGDFIARDTSQFMEFSSSDSWNELIFSELASNLDFNLKERDGEIFGAAGIDRNPAPVIKSTLKRRLKTLSQFIACRLTFDNSVFVISPYLGLMQSIIFQLKLGQFPTQWEKPKMFVEEQPDFGLRSGIKDQSDDFGRIAFTMMKRHIPIIFSEGYKSSLAAVEKLSWPSAPRTIITGTSWAEDDLFKLWAGDNVENGASLVTIQHGGNYGVALWNFFEEHQIKISDKFLTWGWGDDINDKIIPFCNTKLLKKNIPYSKTGGMLIVGLSMPIFSYHMYSAPVALGQWQQYFIDQASFLKGLPNEIINQTTLRLAEPDYGCSQREKWNEQLQLDKYSIVLEQASDCSIDKSWRRCRLCVATYNSTTFLETMTLNIPTVIFWNPEHWELREAVRDDFDELRRVGILHDSPESAAQHVNNIWSELTFWWENEAVQTVRRDFCSRYSHRPENGLNRLAELCVSDDIPT